jgi:Raf kinase inhibitor-like YbhB/YbcL family protein
LLLKKGALKRLPSRHPRGHAGAVLLVARDAQETAMLEKLPDAVGHALRHQRAGLEETLFWRLDLRQGMGAIQVSSLAFADHAAIPSRYTADGEGASPPVQWTGVPPSATEVVLVVEDADAPTPHPLVHAIVCGLGAQDGSLPESAMNDGTANDGDIGRNSFLRVGWLPPDPPPGHGEHRYVFQVFALGPGDPLPATPGRDAVRQAIESRGIASGQMIGTYERPDASIREPGEAGVAIGAAEPAP